MSKPLCECEKTHRQRAQDAMEKAVDAYNQMMKDVEEDPRWVGRHLGNMNSVLKELIDAVGFLVYETKK